ncbi:MFS transporter [Paraburkholderia tropica]|uniref:MFS transporter n=1 Tax=Paraburkholderia tropica TaxID=92647 RepID=UPI002AB66E95|nr:MFS transporter [Paraburkholderia tropica]
MSETEKRIDASELDGLPPRQQVIAMVTIAISLTLALLDSAVANVALPMIAVDMHSGASTAIWVVNGYQLALAVCLLPFATLGEKHGYRTVYKAGLMLFTLSSLACAFSHSMLALTLSRVLQGVGAAGIMSVNTALVRYIVPRSRLGSAIGINAMVAGTAATLGPTVAGAILSVASWPWLFVINVPLGLVAMALARRNLPDNDRSMRSFDLAGALLGALSIGMLITSVESLGHGMKWQAVVAQLVICVVAGTLLIRKESRIALPQFPFDLLRIPVFALSLCTSVGAFAAQMMAYVALPFFLHGSLGYPPAMVGLLMTPWPLLTGLVAPIAGRLSDRVSPGLLGGIGLAALSTGLVCLAWMPETPRPFDIAWRMMLCGAGFGLFQSPNNRTIIGAAPKSRSGAASGMLGTARLTGQSLGTALVALALGALQLQGVLPGLLCAAVLAGCACVISLLRIRSQRG